MKVCMKPRSVNWLHPDSQLVLLNTKFSKIIREFLCLGWKNSTGGVGMWDQAERKWLCRKNLRVLWTAWTRASSVPLKQKMAICILEELAGMQPAAWERWSLSSVEHWWGHAPRAVSHLVSLGTSWAGGHCRESCKGLRGWGLDGAQELRAGWELPLFSLEKRDPGTPHCHLQPHRGRMWRWSQRLPAEDTGRTTAKNTGWSVGNFD